MRHTTTAAALAVAVAFLATGPDALGASMNWEGTATVYLYDDHGPSVYFFGGGVATVNGTSGVVPDHLDTIRIDRNRGRLTGSHTTFVTDPEVSGSGLAAIQFIGIEAGTGTVPGSFPGERLPGMLPVNGIVGVCILSPSCTSRLDLAIVQPATLNGVATGGEKGVGIGGLLTLGGFGGIRFSIQAAPWTIKTVTATNNVRTPGGGFVLSRFARAGWAHGPLSGSSSTAAIGGDIQLVTPIRVESNQPQGFGNPSGTVENLMGTIGAVRFRFIPEPGLLLLLGSGIAGLVAVGRVRR